jgi:PadR family transcriptional regulator, regulatory protein PadR
VRQEPSSDRREGQTDGDDLLRDFFLGFVKIHVLQHASRAPVYGLALIEELGRHGYRLGPGSLYPLLHSLEEAGFLTRADRIVSGRIRKYYVSTGAGERALDEARMKVRELVDEVLEGADLDQLADPTGTNHEEDAAHRPSDD